jgi:hypothetical protein
LFRQSDTTASHMVPAVDVIEDKDAYHIEDSNLGIVSNLLSYSDATVSCDRFNREQVEAQNYGRAPWA